MRRYNSIVLCLLMAGLIVIFYSTADAADPILWFHFEDSGDAVEDGSGNGNNGTIVDASRVADGKYGKGIQIGKKDEYVEIANILTPQATVEFWFKPNWDGGDAETYRLFDANTGAIYYMIGKGKAVGDRDTTFGFYLEDAADADFQDWQVPADGTIVANQWHHIAATWDFDAGEANFYINGEESGQVIGLGAFPPLNANPRIGHNVDTGYMAAANGADAIIDEFAIYDVVLDIDEIRADMENLGFAVEPADKLPAMWGGVKAGL